MTSLHSTEKADQKGVLNSLIVGLVLFASLLFGLVAAGAK